MQPYTKALTARRPGDGRKVNDGEFQSMADDDYLQKTGELDNHADSRALLSRSAAQFQAAIVESMTSNSSGAPASTSGSGSLLSGMAGVFSSQQSLPTWLQGAFLPPHGPEAAIALSSRSGPSGTGSLVPIASSSSTAMDITASAEVYSTPQERPIIEQLLARAAPLGPPRVASALSRANTTTMMPPGSSESFLLRAFHNREAGAPPALPANPLTLQPDRLPYNEIIEGLFPSSSSAGVNAPVSPFTTSAPTTSLTSGPDLSYELESQGHAAKRLRLTTSGEQGEVAPASGRPSIWPVPSMSASSWQAALEAHCSPHSRAGPGLAPTSSMQRTASRQADTLAALIRQASRQAAAVAEAGAERTRHLGDRSQLGSGVQSLGSSLAATSSTSVHPHLQQTLQQRSSGPQEYSTSGAPYGSQQLAMQRQASWHSSALAGALPPSPNFSGALSPSRRPPVRPPSPHLLPPQASGGSAVAQDRVGATTSVVDMEEEQRSARQLEVLQGKVRGEGGRRKAKASPRQSQKAQDVGDRRSEEDCKPPLRQSRGTKGQGAAREKEAGKRDAAGRQKQEEPLPLKFLSPATPMDGWNDGAPVASEGREADDTSAAQPTLQHSASEGTRIHEQQTTDRALGVLRSTSGGDPVAPVPTLRVTSSAEKRLIVPRSAWAQSLVVQHLAKQKSREGAAEDEGRASEPVMVKEKNKPGGLQITADATVSVLAEEESPTDQKLEMRASSCSQVIARVKEEVDVSLKSDTALGRGLQVEHEEDKAATKDGSGEISPSQLRLFGRWIAKEP